MQSNNVVDISSNIYKYNLRYLRRLNSTHTMVAGGFAAVFKNMTEGGHQANRTWIYDGQQWKETAEMKIARDRPACSLVNMHDGKVTSFI